MTIETTPATTKPKQDAGQHWLDLANATEDPFQCIAMALTGLLELAIDVRAGTAAEEDQSALLEQLDREIGERDGTIAAVRAAVGKSTAGWADKIRAALGDDQAEEPAGETEPSGVPANDAPIEEWVAFARAQGLDGDLERMNRSQIRTALGMSHS